MAVLAQGTYGTTTWTIDNGTLTFSGGEWNNTVGTTASIPWYPYRENIKKVIFLDEIIVAENSYMKYLFAGTKISFINLSKIKAKKVLSMLHCFLGCDKLNIVNFGLPGIIVKDTGTFSGFPSTGHRFEYTSDSEYNKYLDGYRFYGWYSRRNIPHNVVEMHGENSNTPGNFISWEFSEFNHELKAYAQVTGIHYNGRVTAREIIETDDSLSSPVVFADEAVYVKGEFIEEYELGQDQTIDLEETETLLNDLFPVGTIYETVDETNPGTFLGGTWNRIAEDRVLVAEGTDFLAGSTGGSKYLGQHSHLEYIDFTSTGSTHTHSAYYRSNANAGSVTGLGRSGNNAGTTGNYVTSGTSEHEHTIPARTTGANQPSMVVEGGSIHEPKTYDGNETYDNMPPYTTVYYWERTV